MKDTTKIKLKRWFSFKCYEFEWGNRIHTNAKAPLFVLFIINQFILILNSLYDIKLAWYWNIALIVGAFIFYGYVIWLTGYYVVKWKINEQIQSTYYKLSDLRKLL